VHQQTGDQEQFYRYGKQAAKAVMDKYQNEIDTMYKK
jgi:hypothetical protein